MTKTNARKLKTQKLSVLKKRADKVFSLWVRKRDKACYTCGSANNLQAGHFVSRSYLALRYSEINVHTQCVGCNVFRHGNMSVYAVRLMQQYGGTILDDLNIGKNSPFTSNARQLYSQVIEKYGRDR